MSVKVDALATNLVWAIGGGAAIVVFSLLIDRMLFAPSFEVIEYPTILAPIALEDDDNPRSGDLHAGKSYLIRRLSGQVGSVQITMQTKPRSLRIRPLSDYRLEEREGLYVLDVAPAAGSQIHLSFFVDTFEVARPICIESRCHSEHAQFDSKIPLWPVALFSTFLALIVGMKVGRQAIAQQT